MEYKFDFIKVQDLKNRFIHFNHIKELRIGNEQDMMHIPQEYHFGHDFPSLSVPPFLRHNPFQCSRRLP